MEYFTHKFRATIGKHKILAKDEKVLFAYSGSGASVAMLHLIAQVRYLNFILYWFCRNFLREHFLA